MPWNYVTRVTVTAAGTPVRVTATRNVGQTIFFQQVEGNTGKIYICDRATAVTATLTGVVAVLVPPTAGAVYAASLPSISWTKPDAAAGVNAEDFYIDADVNGEYCLVSITD